MRGPSWHRSNDSFAVMEERFMVGRFPDSYPEYKRSTKMLISVIL